MSMSSQLEWNSKLNSRNLKGIEKGKGKYKRKREMLEWAEIPLFGPLGNHLCAAHPLRTCACTWGPLPSLPLTVWLRLVDARSMTCGTASSGPSSMDRAILAVAASRGIHAEPSPPEATARPLGPAPSRASHGLPLPSLL